MTAEASESSAARVARERRTIHAMIALYCRAHHQTSGLCEGCACLRTYADQRLDRCVYGADKPTCATCPIHCYKPALRERVRDVMRYAGPRMLRRHPVLAILHTLDGVRFRDSPSHVRTPSRRSAEPN